MSKEWVLLNCRILRSEDLSELFDENPRAESVFYRLLAATDDFGRMEYDPALLKTDLCPRSRKAHKIFGQAVASLADRRMVFFYGVAGRVYLQVTNYDRYQEDQGWSRIKASCPPPPQWHPPLHLLQALANTKDSRLTPARFGISETCWRQGAPRGLKPAFPQWWQEPEYSDACHDASGCVTLRRAVSTAQHSTAHTQHSTDPSPKEDLEAPMPGFPHSPISEALNALSDSEQTNGHDPEVQRISDIIRVLHAGAPKPGDVTDYFHKRGQPDLGLETAVLAALGYSRADVDLYREPSSRPTRATSPVGDRRGE